ncbi:MAG TPA: hypothetical protein VKS01_00640, partial [Bryobacteraceae bacterium]|nr:hypothetical protein [Bryobacteraceae bacterium]
MGWFGRIVFSLAIAEFGVETIVCAHSAQPSLGPGYQAIPVIPWVPAIVWIAYLAGAIWIACGAGLLVDRSARWSAIVFAALFTAWTLVKILPRAAALPGDMSLRTVVLEPLAITAFALLSTGQLVPVCRGTIGVSFAVFGVDHFLDLKGIGSLLPAWIPWHVFWVGFFGAVFIACAASIGLRILERWGLAGIGLMFATWVITLHAPRVMGIYGIPGAPRKPGEWSSLFIAVALWGGPWAALRGKT